MQEEIGKERFIEPIFDSIATILKPVDDIIGIMNDTLVSKLREALAIAKNFATDTIKSAINILVDGIKDISDNFKAQYTELLGQLDINIDLSVLVDPILNTVNLLVTAASNAVSMIMDQFFNLISKLDSVFNLAVTRFKEFVDAVIGQVTGIVRRALQPVSIALKDAATKTTGLIDDVFDVVNRAVDIGFESINSVIENADQALPISQIDDVVKGPLETLSSGPSVIGSVIDNALGEVDTLSKKLVDYSQKAVDASTVLAVKADPAGRALALVEENDINEFIGNIVLTIGGVILIYLGIKLYQILVGL
jgi:phage-related protein